MVGAEQFESPSQTGDVAKSALGENASGEVTGFAESTDRGDRLVGVDFPHTLAQFREGNIDGSGKGSEGSDLGGTNIDDCSTGGQRIDRPHQPMARVLRDKSRRVHHVARGTKRRRITKLKFRKIIDAEFAGNRRGNYVDAFVHSLRTNGLRS